MTVKELSKYHDYTAMMKAIEDEIIYLYQKSAKLTQNYSNSEGRAVGGKGTDMVGNSAVLIADRQNDLRRMKELCEYERERISNYIFGDVTDGLVRAMMYARFIKLLPWYKVATYVGGGNTADSCRMAVFRYCRGDT